MSPFARVRILGRFMEKDNVLWLSSSAAEISFSVSGCTFLKIELAGDSSSGDPEEISCARYDILVDGRSAGPFLMTEKTRVHALADGNQKRNLRVRIVKLSESQDSSIGISGIETDGEIAPEAEKPLKIEFIGDSITCAYGVEGSLDEPYTTTTENASISYAALAAKALDADFQITAFSGFGVVSGYTLDGVINTESLLPPYYDSVGFSRSSLPDGTSVQEYAWDFARFQPDFAVVNLGTNDMSYCLDEEKKDAYREKYVEFLKTVRARNPKAKILCVLGVMGESLCPWMEKAAADYRAQTGDERVRALSVPDQLSEDGYGTDYHPSPVTHRKLADRVSDALAQWMREGD